MMTFMAQDGARPAATYPAESPRGLKGRDSEWDVSEMALKNALEIFKESIKAISQLIDISKPSLPWGALSTVSSAIKIIDAIH